MAADAVAAVPDVHDMPVRSITYSERYCDDQYEYRHVVLPPEMVTLVPRSHLMSETEWRNLGIQQSTGWQHFMLHNPEPHVLIFRRPKPPPQSSQDETETKISGNTQPDPSEEKGASGSTVA